MGTFHLFSSTEIDIAVDVPQPGEFRQPEAAPQLSHGDIGEHAENPIAETATDLFIQVIPAKAGILHY